MQKEMSHVTQDAQNWFAQRSDIFGVSKTREEVLEDLKQYPETYGRYLRLSGVLQKEFLEFCMGTRGMSITYDPVFKRIFNPEANPERLEEFLSLCLGEALEILQVLPSESSRLTEKGSLLVMDILVRLASGALVNVEIQKIGYRFLGARCACYSSDLMMRQYSRIRSQKQEEGKRFSYANIQKVYTIVLIQNSTKEFHQLPDVYLHYARQCFNTGLKVDLLQEYLLIPLDIFRENNHNISNKLEAWLSFIISDKPEDIRRVMEAYPEFQELYREVFRFRFQTKELVSMFSEALKILDENTVQYMIEEQQEQIKALLDEKKQLEEQKRKQEEQYRRQEEQRKKQEEKNRKQQEEIAQQQAEIERLKALLNQKDT